MIKGKTQKNVPEGGTGYGRDHQAQPPKNGNGGNLMNQTKPTSGGNPPMPPKGTSAAYGKDCGE